MSRALGPDVDVEIQRRRTAAARSHRVAAAGRGSVLPEDDRARLADDTDDVLRESHRPRQDADERSRVVVAPARERSGPRHVVPAERGRAAAGQCAARGRSDHPAGRRAALRRRHHRRAPEYRHAAPRLRPEARRNRRAGRAEAGARQRERDAGHDDGGDSPGTDGQRDPSGGAGAHEGEGHRRHAVFASDRRARPRRRSAHRPVGSPGRRPRPRRRDRDSVDVVLDRAAGDDAGARSGAASPCAWRRRKTRSSAPMAKCAGRCGGRTNCFWSRAPADQGRRGDSRVIPDSF